MEGGESAAIFESLSLNPQLFINEVFNSVDDLVDGAFDYFNQEASTVLKIEGTDRSGDLKKGVAYLRNMVQSVLDKRLGMWEKYTLRHCFVVPEGFSLPKADDSAGESSMDLDFLSDQELDAQLDSLRYKLAQVGKETAELDGELYTLERQISLNSDLAGSVNGALQLYEQQSQHGMFQELIQTASELRKRMEEQRTKRLEQEGRTRAERKHISNGDLFRMNFGNGLSNATPEELEEFIADMKHV
ncbi:protein MIS12 homolog [Diospyros lotus]|uniref:protein MIS12 homolog n=1 Tax=Diospyros lotus TaxID=55363 RepID=UPI002258A4A9|nr:protein MIS12 homolog [Diospyros lotus]